jgi:hypothetical protein
MPGALTETDGHALAGRMSGACDCHPTACLPVRRSSVMDYDLHELHHAVVNRLFKNLLIMLDFSFSCMSDIH